MKINDVMILPDERDIRAQLAKARKRLEKYPDSWVWLEQIGRCLRWLGNPEAVEYFRQGAANYKVKGGHAGDQIRLGNLHRLAGNDEAAERHFEQARALYTPRAYREKPNPLDVEHMIPASFLVGQDIEVSELINCLQSIDKDTDLIAYPIAKLAEARRASNAELAKEGVVEISNMIRRSRAKVWNTGGVLLWDWYEIGVETWRLISQSEDE
jgi:hypothetical protein